MGLCEDKQFIPKYFLLKSQIATFSSLKVLSFMVYVVPEVREGTLELQTGSGSEPL